MTAVIRGRLRDGALVDQQTIFKADPSLYRAKGYASARACYLTAKAISFSVGDRDHPGDEQDLLHTQTESASSR